MQKFILGKKIGMTQIIQDSGVVVPVTVIKAGPCAVVDIRTQEKNGYMAILLGYEDLKEKHLNMPKSGYFKKQAVVPKKYLKEFRVDSTDNYELNGVVDISVFSEDDEVCVKSKSIGKGFAGTVKRHNFSRGPMTHGSKNHRLPGSIGAGTDPARVFKGTKMGGHMGNQFVTVKGLVIVKVDSEKGLLYIKGSVPGKKNNLVEIFR